MKFAKTWTTISLVNWAGIIFVILVHMIFWIVVIEEVILEAKIECYAKDKVKSPPQV